MLKILRVDSLHCEHLKIVEVYNNSQTKIYTFSFYKISVFIKIKKCIKIDNLLKKYIVKVKLFISHFKFICTKLF